MQSFKNYSPKTGLNKLIISIDLNNFSWQKFNAQIKDRIYLPLSRIHQIDWYQKYLLAQVLYERISMPV